MKTTDKILYSPKEGTTGFWFNGVDIVNSEIEKEKNRSLNQTTRSHADISYECGLDFTLRLLDSITPKK